MRLILHIFRLWKPPKAQQPPTNYSGSAAAISKRRRPKSEQLGISKHKFAAGVIARNLSRSGGKEPHLADSKDSGFQPAKNININAKIYRASSILE